MPSAASPVRKRWILAAVLWAVGVWLGSVRVLGDEAAWSRFKADLDALTASPHRLSGTPEAAAAADHIERRLRAIPGVEVFLLDMPVWQTRVIRCELILGGQRVPLDPLRPNLIVPPVTPGGEGLTADLIYVGRGTPEEYGERSAAGKIVVMEYDCYLNWERAFALGAEAVIFLGSDATPLYPKHTAVPANYPRFYVEDAALSGLNLRQDHAQVRLTSHVTWEIGRGRNLLALIPGTDPGFVESRQEKELVILSAGYDSFGVVPTRAPGARGAANVAALLAAVEQLAANRPRRDVLAMFLDNEARMHQGARLAYDTLTTKAADLAALAQAHQDELRFRRAMMQTLAAPDRLASDDPSVFAATYKYLYDQAYFIHSDLKQDQVRRRIARDAIKASDPDRYEAIRQDVLEMDHRIFLWDNLRRALHYRWLDNIRATVGHILAAESSSPSADQRRAWATTLRQSGIRRGFEGLEDGGDWSHAVAEARLYEELIRELLAVSTQRLQARAAELEQREHQDQQRKALNDRLGGYWIVLHGHYNFSDAGPTWGVVVGNRMDALFPYKRVGSSSDTPGYYGRVLGAFREAAGVLPADSGLYADTLKDTSMGMQFAPGVFTTPGFVAGTYGVYNVSLMTGYDARPRDGHPSDRVEKLDWQLLGRQAREGTTLLRALSDSAEISLPRQFSNQSATRRASWKDGRSSGDYAALRVTGSLQEDRPAYQAVMAIWPGRDLRNVWATVEKLTVAPGFDPLLLERVDMNGRYEILGVQKEIFNTINTLGGTFDGRGKVTAISTQKTLYRNLTAAGRAELFIGEGYGLAALPGQRATPETFKVLRAASDSPLPTTRSLVGQSGNFSFFYISRQDVNTGIDRVKLFQPFGPVLLNSTRAEPYGEGVTLERLALRPALAEPTAMDLWSINEWRLNTLRSRGVTSEDLELLHSRARRALDVASGTVRHQEVQAPADPVPAALRKAKLTQSAALSRAVYSPLRKSMDDLVHAIVVLLLLAIPFAFAIERLLFCATSVYGRLLGFTAAFLVTFGLLYTMHPGFAIATTPIIIFLAFAILLLSIMVIHIIVRKFRTELKAMQGQRVGLHDVEVSRMGTLLAAVGMGMSTMRRRPTRTFLTAITVIMLTFTILSFASFTRKIGVRSVYEGPLGEEASGQVMVRKLDYSAMREQDLDLVRGLEGEGGDVFGQYWMVRRSESDLPFTVARAAATEHADQRLAMSLDAVLGVSTRELGRWPGLRQALRGGASDQERLEALDRGGVFLPPIVVDRLGLKTGDPVLLNGRVSFVAGTFDSAAIQRLKHLDGQSVLPVNFQDPSAQQSQQQTTSDNLAANDMVDKDFVHLSADQVAIASAATVQQQGGNLHAVVVYLGPGIDPLARAEEIARVVPMPLWARGAQGVERMILTTLTEVSGGLALAVPVILGGLIIFGTLLGSISDREKEIYTFSALGLAPGHVGVLFFAEAAVYAVVGGMGGQLLAQIVAQVSSYLADLGLIATPQINYSSTNSLFAIGIVMATVLISAIYPAVRASRSANPGLARAWKMPPPDGDRLEMTFPFTVSAYDITGVVSFLAEHFERHDDAGLGSFAAQNVRIGKTAASSPDQSRNNGGNLYLSADLALAPFDLGVTQAFTLTARPSEIPGVDEVGIAAMRKSGANGDWLRANRVFLRDLRKQFLLWRTLSAEMIENYRMNTLSRLGHEGDLPTPGANHPGAPAGLSPDRTPDTP